ncbi:MAG TPA: hypothetical protein VF139_15635 [Candidatus Polarisedimenticolaceae bacterium]
MRVLRSVFAAALLVPALAVPAHAGPYGDDLAQCLVEKSSDADKTTLIKWFFAMAATHPDVKSIAAITAEQRDGLNRDVAQLFQTLLTDTCKNETKKAMKYEPQTAMQSSFSVLGQVAAQGLFSDEGVAANLGEFTKYVDEEKLQAVLKSGE